MPHHASHATSTGAIQFTGYVNYCYADAAAMFLSGHGFHGVDPGRIEVLTGISLMGGHRLSEPECEKLYFSLVPGPQRLSTAFDLLGFTVTAQNAAAGADPVALLRADLATGPVLLGPIDMGSLRYFPFHQHARGADHYVVAYAIEGDRVRAHDPLGFPFTAMDFDDLASAWMAKDLPCPGGPYHRWHTARREAEPSAQEVYRRAVEYFETIRAEVPAGGETIREYAGQLRAGELNARSLAFLTIFSFPVQARRGMDYALFFHEGGNLAMARRKLRGAELFGECLQAGNAADWGGVADRLMEIADLEDETAATSFLL